MNFTWGRELRAIIYKEWLAEVRSKHGLYTSLLFSVLAVVATSFASFGQRPSGALAGGMLTLALLFASVLSLPRLLLIEDEQRTFEVLRLIARADVILVGKMIAGTAQMLVTGLALSIAFAELSGTSITHWPLFLASVGIECISLSSAVCLCGALVLGGANRWVLAAVLAIPVLLPQVIMSVGALRAALGDGSVLSGWQNAVGLLGFAVALFAIGPIVVTQVWNTE